MDTDLNRKDILGTTAGFSGTGQEDKPGPSGQQISIFTAKPVLPGPESPEPDDSRPLHKRHCSEFIAASQALLKEKHRKQKELDKASAYRERKKTKQKSLEALMRENVIGWHPDLIKSKISVKDPSTDKSVVTDWLAKQLPDKTSQERSVIADQLQSGAKLKTPSLQPLEGTFKTFCSNRVWQEKQRIYMARLEQAAAPYQSTSGKQESRAEQQARDKKEQEKEEQQQLEKLACFLDPDLTAEKIKASITYTPCFKDQEFLAEFLTKHYPHGSETAAITRPEHLPASLLSQFLDICSVENTRRWQTQYLQTLNQIIDQGLARLDLLPPQVPGEKTKFLPISTIISER